MYVYGRFIHVVCDSGSRRSSSESHDTSPVAAAVQILPETLVTGAVNVASSAINTARSVIDMLRPRHEEPPVSIHLYLITQHTDLLIVY